MGDGTIRWLRLVALSAALAGVLLLATGAAWWHIETPGSVDSCPICCHTAHISAVPEAFSAASTASVVVAWLLAAERLLLPGDPSVVVPPSRAPPALA